MKTYVFQKEIADKIGLESAVIIQNIYYWVRKNADNNLNFVDNHYWTYNSVRAFTKQLSFLSEKVIRNRLNTLEKEGYILSGNYNKSSYDRTKWYTLTSKGFTLFNEKLPSTCTNGQMDKNEQANGNYSMGEPIPYNKPYNKHNIKTIPPNTLSRTDNVLSPMGETDTAEKGKAPSPVRKNFKPPALEEVKRYCRERDNCVDPEAFVDFYESKGWFVGKNKMKSWKAAVRTWERHDGREKPMKQSDRDRLDKYDIPF